MSELTGRSIAQYRLLEKIGEGGMGEVYRAHDRKLDRQVALKFLSPRLLSGEDERDRFLREARAAAALDHPGICTVHEIGEDGGRVFIAMQLLEGPSLQDRLAEGPLPVEDALDLAARMASALGEAHERGLVHRDVKPGNVMLDRRGRPVLTDFGLALSESAARLTRDGTSRGTPAYMSPEQARGGETDARSDLWSLGVMLFEMISGELPFRGDHEPALLYSLCHEEPRPLRSPEGELPGALRDLVLRCMEKDPDRRFTTAGELESELRRLLAAWRGEALPPAAARPRGWRQMLLRAVPVLALALIVFSATPPGQGLWRNFWTGDLPEHKYLAVLPFSNIGGDPENQALCDGLQEYLSSRLTELEGLRDSVWVVSAADVRRSEVGSSLEARQVFEVTLAVTGSVQRQEDGYSVTLNLVDARSQRQLQSKTLRDESKRASLLQSEALGRLVEMLQVELGPGESREIARVGTEDPEAHEHYLKALGYMGGLDFLQLPAKLDALDTAAGFFRLSLQEDPGYALAHAGLAEACWLSHFHGRESRWVQMAEAHCDSALAREDIPAARITLSRVLAARGDFAAALEHLEQVLAEDPVNAEALRQRGRVLDAMRRHEEAEAASIKAIALRPGDWGPYADLGSYYLRRGRLDEAVEQFQKVVALAPNNYYRGYNDLGGIFLYQQKLGEAELMLERSLAIKPNYKALSNLGALAFYRKDYARAEDMYRRALALHDHDYRIWDNLASTLMRMPGRKEEAAPIYGKAMELLQEELRLQPENPRYLTLLASYHRILGQERESMILLERVVELDPDNMETCFRLAHGWEKLGERDMALRWLGRALDLGYPRASVENSASLTDLRLDPRYQDLFEGGESGSTHNR